ncbi:hypothetical protein C475_06205 [Halosimplex carlsbadense 2-9-1]|uniref:Major facilitator superfamily (MFS) profile domain-containing protein n=1 Tax=Halosimplex carlsbadense 2-9-1 TaxID=797114 RepID=M0D037_9EURY|nr:hypothetical protein [Halosimplex carlsbadense]ELZ27489.1 hypothetical protein C475_06205 [Halosimplex carlsbadense 2-9-1]
MDEVLDVAEVAADFGLEGVFRAILGLVGVLLILGGLGLWLLTDMGLLVLPAALMIVGVLLLVAPVVLFGIGDLL